MRVLSLGYALPDSQVDNYDWASALSFFDYDAIVVDPAVAVSTLIERVVNEGAGYVTFTDEPVEDGPTTPNGVGLTDLLRRRRDETERLLARGGLVVCFGYPDVGHSRVAGFSGCHRYYWLPAPAGLDYGPGQVKAAAGTHVSPTDYEHPFANLLERFHAGVQYRAIFSEGAAGLASHGKVIGRSPGAAAVAIDLAVGGGRIIFLPAMPERLSNQERQALAGAIVTAIRNTLLIAAESEPPEWLDDYPLPGIADAQKQVLTAEARFDEVEAELDGARNDYRGIDRFRRLLWQEGKYGLELPVRDILVLLGFKTFSPVDEPAALTYNGEIVYLETQAGEDAVGMEPHYRLRQRLEAKIAADGRPVRGLIVVNGHRGLPPAERPQQYENSLRVAAESMRYCVVETTQLFEAVRAHLEGDKERVSELCRRIVTTEGALTAPASEGAESS